MAGEALGPPLQQRVGNRGRVVHDSVPRRSVTGELPIVSRRVRFGNRNWGSYLLPLAYIVGDALFFDLCVDVDKLPADKMKAYYEVELKALSALNDSGLPTAKQKREAKEAARERLEEEAKDGRYKRRKLVPVMWDSVTNEVLFGATSLSHVDRLVSLFQQTFGFGLEPVSAGKRAYELAPGKTPASTVEDSRSSAFIPGVSADDVAWIPDDTSRDFLGNELWLFADSCG